MKDSLTLKNVLIYGALFLAGVVIGLVWVVPALGL